VSLICDQLIPVNKAVNAIEQSERGLEEEDKSFLSKTFLMPRPQKQSSLAFKRACQGLVKFWCLIVRDSGKRGKLKRTLISMLPVV
jgi:hypothetical protein